MIPVWTAYQNRGKCFIDSFLDIKYAALFSVSHQAPCSKGNKTWKRNASWPPETWNSGDLKNKTKNPSSDHSTRQMKPSQSTHRRKGLILTVEIRENCVGKNAIQARIWGRGRILIGGDWGKELLLAKKMALRHARAGLIWGQIGICFEYIGKDMWREVVEPHDPTIWRG